MPPNMPDRHLPVNTEREEYAYLAVEREMPTAHTPRMKKVKALRESRKLTQQQLADKVGANQATISKIEKGIANPTQAMIERIAAALDVDPIALFDLNDLQARALGALARMEPGRQEAALLVLEAMAQSEPD